MGSGTLMMRKLGEALNLRTNQDLKTKRSSMTPEALARIDKSNRRGLAASFTGFIIQSVLSPMIPGFIVPAAVNAYQTVIGLVNRERSKEEQVKRQVKTDPKLKALFKDRRKRDIFTGVAVKVLTSGIGLGLDDLGKVADEFVKLHHHVPEDQLPSKIIDRFEERNPEAALADKRIHLLNSGPADAFRDTLGHALLNGKGVVETTTSIEGLEKIQQAGNSPERMVAQAVPSGIVSELVQPLNLSIEKGVDAARSYDFDQRQRQAATSTYTSTYTAPSYSSYQTSYYLPQQSHRRRIWEFIKRNW